MLVLVLEGEDAGIGPVLVGKELAERVRVFDSARLERLETIGLVDLADGREHPRECASIGRAGVLEALRQARLRALIFLGFLHGGGPRCLTDGGDWPPYIALRTATKAELGGRLSCKGSRRQLTTLWAKS